MNSNRSKPNFLINLMSELAIEGFEKSFKMSKNCLLTKRFLIAIKHPEKQRRNIFDYCHKLSMPSELLQLFRQDFKIANRAYFGYEEDSQNAFFKVYLEFWDYALFKKLSTPNSKDPFTLYKGYKWNDSNNSSNNLTCYTLYPQIPLTQMHKLITDVSGNHSESVNFSIVKKIVSSSSAKTDCKLLKFLYVTEKHNVRKSFDINLYPAGLKIQDIQNELEALRSYYDIDITAFELLYQTIKQQQLGHIAGGVDRTGNDFMTLYYSSENL